MLIQLALASSRSRPTRCALISRAPSTANVCFLCIHDRDQHSRPDIAGASSCVSNIRQPLLSFPVCLPDCIRANPIGRAALQRPYQRREKLHREERSSSESVRRETDFAEHCGAGRRPCSSENTHGYAERHLSTSLNFGDHSFLIRQCAVTFQLLCSTFPGSIARRDH